MLSHDLIRDAVEQVRSVVDRALREAAAAGALPAAEVPDYTVEIPADTAHGDFAANIALVGARAMRLPPQKIAQALLERFDFAGTYFERAEAAGPGFLNFTLRPRWFCDVLRCIAERGADYGKTETGKGKKVMVEFVSANPTGPMHMGNARGGAIGDCLAAALAATGCEVEREFYVNDAGNQIEKFAKSLQARYLQIYRGEAVVPFPEDGYQGEDIRDRAAEFAALHADRYVDVPEEERCKALVAYALPHNIGAMQADMEKYRIRFDTWFRESSLYESGMVDKIVGLLRERGLTYEKDGALWYKATECGGEKDEVLVRQNGNATYFAADIAYHYNKFAVRGFDAVIDVWGADHHGHVARLKGAMDAVGLRGERLHILLMQMVNLLKDGEPYRMSKRTGRSVSLSDLLELVPIDAARFFFNMQQPGSTMDFDLDLAVETSSQNPVYYVQYAHARICSILRRLAEEGVRPQPVDEAQLLLLSAPEEIALIRRLAALPSDVAAVAARYDPSILTHCATDLATLFHKFYTACRVRVDDRVLMLARLHLCVCTRIALCNVLALLGIDAPESM